MKTCEKCGYVLSAFDTECPRCKRREKTPCSICGKPGIVGVCAQCHKEICQECAIPRGEAVICKTCEAKAEAEEKARAQEERARAAPQIGRVRGVSTGWWDSIVRAFIFLRESTKMAFRDKDLFIPSVLSLLFSAIYLGVILLIAWQVGGADLFKSEEGTKNYAGYIVMAVIAFGGYVITYFFNGMTVNLVDTHIKGRDARLGEAFADALKNLFSILSLALVAPLVSMITSAMRSKRGRGLGDLAADAIDKAWTVAAFLLLPAIIIEDISLRQAISRATDLHRRNLVPILVGEIAVSLVTGVITFIGIVVAVIVGFLIYQATAGAALYAAIAVAGIMFAMVLAFAMYVRTSYYTCLYIWAAETEAVGEKAMAPAPLAEAMA